jgi:uncharacterized membrane protein
MSQRRRRKGGAARRSPQAEAAARSPRLASVDALRGLGLSLMIVYHFIWDLDYFRVVSIDFNHALFWLTYRDLVVAWFMFLVGVSLVLARRTHPGLRPFWRRIALIVFCAVLVSAASYVLFPETFISFGMLHAIAVASVLARPLVQWPRTSLVLGLAIIAAGATQQFPLFDAPWLNWVGMMTHKPATEDYVPLFPWLGVVLVGVAAGAWLTARERRAAVSLDHIAPRWLAWFGRHSLLVYMLHQPILFGMLRVVV